MSGLKEAEAQSVLAEANQDGRISARINSRYARRDGQGYQVVLELCRGRRQLTIGRAVEWPEVRRIWQDL